jgi:hypothetical protein
VKPRSVKILVVTTILPGRKKYFNVDTCTNILLLWWAPAIEVLFVSSLRLTVDRMADAFNHAVQVLVERGWPSPVGLLMGLAGVLIAQVTIFLTLQTYFPKMVLLIAYAPIRLTNRWPTVQDKQPPQTTLFEDLWGHVAAPGSFIMVYG